MRRLTLETSTLQEIEEDIENFKRTCNKILKVDIRQELKEAEQVVIKWQPHCQSLSDRRKK